MALKTWIDEIKTDESGPKSEASREPASVPDHSTFVEKRIEAILILTVHEIEQNLNGVQYRSTSETKTAEEKVNCMARGILAGDSMDFDSLYRACSCWVATARQRPALFEGLNK